MQGFDQRFDLDVKNITITSNFSCRQRERSGIKNIVGKMQHFMICFSGEASTLECAKPLLIKSFQRYYRFSQRQTKVSMFYDTLTVPLFCRSTFRGVADSSPGKSHLSVRACFQPAYGRTLYFITGRWHFSCVEIGDWPRTGCPR